MRKFTLSGVMVAIGFMALPFHGEAAGNEIIFTYDYPGAEHDLFGIQRQVGIDVAMKLQDTNLTGAKIKGISVDIPTKEGCSCDSIGSAWLTRTLQTAGEYNLPDLQQVNGLIRNYGTEDDPELRLDLTFPEAYTLTEEGVYVGYSVTVKSCLVPGSGWTAKYPIVTVVGIDKPETFIVHCTKGESTLPQKYAEWTDLSSDKKQALAMRVILETEAKSNAATLTPLQTLYVSPGTTGSVYADLINNGTNPISSFTYSYSVGDAAHVVKEWKLEKPLDGQLGAFVNLDLPFEAPEKEGEYEVSVRIEKVNGEPNGAEGTSSLNMTVVPFLPKNRPLLEDYTGFWCGNCPEVYVLTHQMMDKYGEDFLSLSYHTGDQVQGVATDAFPSSAYGIPKVYMGDRNEALVIENIESIWLRRCRELAPAAIDVKLYWEDEDHTVLRAESDVRFVYDQEGAEYMLTYALVEDDMSNPTWRQTNYYTNDNFEGPYWDLFCGQPRGVAGLVYDDVIVSFPSTRGISGSLPASVTSGESYRHETLLNLQNAVCRYNESPMAGKSIILDTDKLRVVALLIDGKTGAVCNSATTGYSGDAQLFGSYSAVSQIASESEIVKSEYYSLEGIRLREAPAQGGYVKVSTMSDGNIKTEKRMNVKKD